MNESAERQIAGHGGDTRRRVETEAKQRLAEERTPAFYYRDVECTYDSGVLRLRGRVPTYYLKQLLQTRLMSIQGVAALQNEVEVVSSAGLSCAR